MSRSIHVAQGIPPSLMNGWAFALERTAFLFFRLSTNYCGLKKSISPHLPDTPMRLGWSLTLPVRLMMASSRVTTTESLYVLIWPHTSSRRQTHQMFHRPLQASTHLTMAARHALFSNCWQNAISVMSTHLMLLQQRQAYLRKQSAELPQSLPKLHSKKKSSSTRPGQMPGVVVTKRWLGDQFLFTQCAVSLPIPTDFTPVAQFIFCNAYWVRLMSPGAGVQKLPTPKQYRPAPNQQA